MEPLQLPEKVQKNVARVPPNPATQETWHPGPLAAVPFGQTATAFEAASEGMLGPQLATGNRRS